MIYMRALSIFEKGDISGIIVKRGNEDIEKVISF
jgi:hypothetical protein